ncbi:hypothetical protein [Streptomyces sp. HUAS TT20]|uniref:hypothetical protein n=1 Tax=Streptomyces sp. HUAS TT20 TaxID=3447509 RepID=UPI0021D9A945|nr:hypothetical protein [Streptomyces sp. HUAS 15-9]UXY32088.1 hypothetical protein N8I87_39765 [Streptomyces sp. HUAS 15-9]
MRRTTPVAVAVTLAAALTAAGCSSDSGGSERRSVAAEKPVDESAAAKEFRTVVEAARSTSVTISQSLVLQDDGKRTLLSIDGPFDLAHDRGKLFVHAGGPIEQLDQIFVGDKTYLSTRKDQWLVTDRSKAESHHLLRAPLNDPQYLLAQIAATTKVTKSSKDLVFGGAATHYRGVLGHHALTSRTAEETRDEIAGYLQDRKGALVSVDAYVKQGRLALVRLDFQMDDDFAHVSLQLSDFGRPVEVTAPPSATPIAPPAKGALAFVTG